MDDKPSNPNIEWKKGGFESQEKLTLKTNVAKAVEYDAKKKDKIFANPTPLPADLPKGLKKIRKKIRDVYDDEDDEDEVQIVVAPLEDNNSLLNALHDDEKKFLKQQETDNIIKQQLDIEKINSINLAEKMAVQAGFKGLKKETIQNSLNENTITPLKLQDTIKKEFKTEIKVGKNQWNELSDKDLMNLMEGVHKIKTIGGKDSLKALKGMDAKEIVEAGKDAHDDKKDMEIARTICEKTGRKDCKAKPKKKEEKETPEMQMVKNQKVNKAFAKERD